jgi:nicotinamidase/pyrazinamidase
VSVRAACVLWDVDTQRDFVLESGSLAVPGAEAALPAMLALVQWARRTGIVHVASADDHELTDPEISLEPDFESTYPPHCLRGTRGAEKILETKQREPLPLSSLPYPPGAIPQLIHGRRELLLLKKSFDVFTNPNTDALLAALDPDEIVLFGVATDVCDDAAIRGFLARGRRVVFVEDAAKGIDESRTAAALAAWRERGVAFTTTDEAVKQFD